MHAFNVTDYEIITAIHKLTGECIFTLESDPNTKIEMTVTQVQLFGNALTVPPPCLELYDVKMDGSIVLLQK